MLQPWARSVSMRASAGSHLRRPVGLRRAVKTNSHRSSSTTQNRERVTIETPKEHRLFHRDPERSQPPGPLSYKELLIKAWSGPSISVESFKLIRYSPTLVSSDTGHEIIGTFSTICDEGAQVPEAEHHAQVYIPGAPPIWKTPPIPYRLPDRSPELNQREPLRFHNGVNGDRADKYLWKIPLRAIESRSGISALNNIDVMITAKRLDGFWKFCSGVTAVDFAANVTLVNNTLFIDGFEPVGLETGPELDRPSRLAVYCNAWPQENADSLQHFQIVRYKLGHLNIAVVAGIETTIQRRTTKEGSLKDTPARVVTFDPCYPRNWLYWGGLSRTWLRRCPGLIACIQEQGHITYQLIQDNDALWENWERREMNQKHLQELVFVFKRLRTLLRQKAPGQPCIVKRTRSIERETDWLAKPSLDHDRRDTKLTVCRAKHGRYPLPLEDVQRLKASATTDVGAEVERLLAELEKADGDELSSAVVNF